MTWAPMYTNVITRSLHLVAARRFVLANDRAEANNLGCVFAVIANGTVIADEPTLTVLGKRV